MKKIIVLLLAIMMCFSLVACGKSEAVKKAEMSRRVLDATEELQISLAKLGNIPITSSQSMIDRCTDLMKEALIIMESHDADPDDEDYIRESERYIEKIEAFNDKVDRLLG